MIFGKLADMYLEWSTLRTAYVAESYRPYKSGLPCNLELFDGVQRSTAKTLESEGYLRPVTINGRLRGYSLTSKGLLRMHELYNLPIWVEGDE